MAIPTIEQLGDSDLLKHCLRQVMIALEKKGGSIQKIKEPNTEEITGIIDSKIKELKIPSAEELIPVLESVVEEKLQELKKGLFDAVDKIDGEEKTKPAKKETKTK